MTPYPKYKDSGIEWMGQIPSHWRSFHLKNCVTIYNGKDYKDIESNEGYPVFGSGGVFTFATDKIYDGEVLLMGRKGTIDKPLYYKGPFWVVDTMFYAIPHSNSHGKFLYYCATQFPFKKISTATALPSMTQTDLYQLPIMLPPLNEQQRITDYLDEKCGDIDGQITLLEKKKKAYERLKTSIINDAVTHGLNPIVTLRHSGIDWIGNIPDHWQVKRLKDIVEVNTETLKEETAPDYTFKYIDISNVSSDGEITLSEDMTFFESPSRARRIVHKGDVIVSTVRTYLKAIAPIDFEANDIIASTGFAVLTPNTIESSFLMYLMRSDYVIDQICSQSSGVSYPAITAGKISTINVVEPPINEQRAIADYLNQKCDEIDAAIENIGKQIDAYKRLKKSLINEVVTGKRAV